MDKIVTILVLVETPLQPKRQKTTVKAIMSHNPCFSGNSFATGVKFENICCRLQSQSLF